MGNTQGNHQHPANTIHQDLSVVNTNHDSVSEKQDLSLSYQQHLQTFLGLANDSSLVAAAAAAAGGGGGGGGRGEAVTGELYNDRSRSSSRSSAMSTSSAASSIRSGSFTFGKAGNIIATSSAGSGGGTRIVTTTGSIFAGGHSNNATPNLNIPIEKESLLHHCHQDESLLHHRHQDESFLHHHHQDESEVPSLPLLPHIPMANVVGLDFFDVLPAECIIEIMTKLKPHDLNATALVSKRWHALIADAEPIWRRRCVELWNHVSMATTPGLVGSWRQAYKVLGHGTMLANTRSVAEALAYLAPLELVPSSTTVAGTAGFLAGTRLITRNRVGQVLLDKTREEKMELLSAIFASMNFKFVFLPNALRLVFARVSIEGTMASSRSVVPIFAAFIDAYVTANPAHAPKRESVHLLCYSCLLLGVDRFNPQVKSKMTKREFSRNNRSVLDSEHYDLAFLDRIYDNICHLGPVAHPRKERRPADALATLT